MGKSGAVGVVPFRESWMDESYTPSTLIVASAFRFNEERFPSRSDASNFWRYESLIRAAREVLLSVISRIQSDLEVEMRICPERREKEVSQMRAK